MYTGTYHERFIREKVNCCVSGEPLTDSKHITAIWTQYLARWEFPTVGNFLTGEKGYALAFVHDRHLKDREKVTKVVEFISHGDGSYPDVIYHEVSGLSKDCLPSTATPDDERYLSGEIRYLSNFETGFTHE